MKKRMLRTRGSGPGAPVLETIFSDDSKDSFEVHQTAKREFTCTIKLYGEDIDVAIVARAKAIYDAFNLIFQQDLQMQKQDEMEDFQ